MIDYNPFGGELEEKPESQALLYSLTDVWQRGMTELLSFTLGRK